MTIPDYKDVIEYQRECSHGEELYWKECPECREFMVRSGFKTELAKAERAARSDEADKCERHAELAYERGKKGEPFYFEEIVKEAATNQEDL